MSRIYTLTLDVVSELLSYHGFYPDFRFRKFTYGGVDEYNNYIVNHVKAFIDRNYRTLSSAKYTVIVGMRLIIEEDKIDVIIVGSSHGGLAAFHMALSHPRIFGIAICMSSSFWAGLDWLVGSTLTNMFYSLEKSILIQV